MIEGINDLALALEQAAKDIRNAAKFRVSKEEIDINEAVVLLLNVKPKQQTLSLDISINLPYSNKIEEVTVEFQIQEGFSTKAKGTNFQACLAAYLETREPTDSLASVARLVKEATKQEIAQQTDPVVQESV